MLKKNLLSFKPTTFSLKLTLTPIGFSLNFTRPLEIPFAVATKNFMILISCRNQASEDGGGRTPLQWRPCGVAGGVQDRCRRHRRCSKGHAGVI